MACEQPREEWTVTTQSRTNGWGHFVFCLNVDSDGKITGRVSELPMDEDGTVVGAPIRLGKVKGRQDLVAGFENDLSLMTIVFNRNDTRISLAGVRVTSDTPNTLQGRFSAFKNWRRAGTNPNPLVVGTNDLVLPAAPVDGDTGTATGTQT